MNYSVLDRSVLDRTNIPVTQFAAPRYIQCPETKYYSVEEEKTANYTVLITMIHWFNSFEARDNPEVGPWFWTIFELMFPKGVKKLFPSTAKFVSFSLKASPFPNWLQSYLITGVVDSTMFTKAELVSFGHPNLQGELTAEQITVIIDNHTPFPGLTYNAVIAAKGSRDIALVMLTVLLSAMGKDPSDNNITYFHYSRPRDIKAEMCISEQESVLLSKNYYSSLGTLRLFKGYFNSWSEMRKQFVVELIKWTKSAGSFKQEIIASQVRLWHGSGYTYVFLIRNFLDTYKTVVATMPYLNMEAELFSKHYDQLMKNNEYEFGYRKVIMGDRDETMKSKYYPALLAIARDVASLDDPGYTNYAPSLPVSPYFGMFKRHIKQHPPQAHQ